MKRTCLFIVLLMTAAMIGPGQAADQAGGASEKRIALVIGNAAYPGDMVLRNPVNDARAMAATLKKLGFDVIAREDTSKSQMEQSLLAFSQQLADGGVGLVYYSGHGMQVGGKNYLLPVDAQIPSEQSLPLVALNVDAILDQMAAARSRVNILILDACRNNPYEKRFRVSGRGSQVGAGLAEVKTAPKGTLIAFSTAPGSEASDGEGVNGLYTQELLKAMREPGLPVEQMFKRVRGSVALLSGDEQIPWENSSLIGEDFYFAGTPAAAAPPSLGENSEIARLRGELEAMKAQVAKNTPVETKAPPPQQLAALPPAATLPPQTAAQPQDRVPTPPPVAGALGDIRACAARTMRGSGEKKTVSAKLGKPLQEAEALIKEKQYAAALQKIAAAEALPDQSPYEMYVTADVKLVAELGAADYAAATRAIESQFAACTIPVDQVVLRAKLAAQLYYNVKNYQKAIEWGSAYVVETQDYEVQILVGQAYYLLNKYAQAVETIGAAISTAQARGVTLKEDWLKLQLSAQYNRGNNAGAIEALVQLNTLYPSAENWENLLTFAEKTQKTPIGAMDIYRLRFVSGALKTAEEYTEMAQIALQQALPGEAKAVLQKGMSLGILGQGPQKDRQMRLLNMAMTQADADFKQLDQSAAEVMKQKTGDAEVKFGQAYASYGQYEKAIDAIKHGISKGVNDNDDAQLRLGIVLLAANQNGQGLAAFKAITPGTPQAQIAQLWMLRSGGLVPATSANR